MTALTSSERMAKSRDRRQAKGLHEVRGIWLPRDLHQMVKDYAADLAALNETKPKARQC